MDTIEFDAGFGGSFIEVVARAVVSLIFVVASWYGPGFYGNHTACGQVFTPVSYGVAHKTLPCGSEVVLTNGGHTVRATVIDRGPYIAGREFDLTGPVKAALGCSDLCVVGWER